MLMSLIVWGMLPHAGPPALLPVVGLLRSMDTVDGGAHRITNVVKIGSQPARRRVLLLDFANARLIRSTWSDAVSGVYMFDWIRPGKYLLVAQDYALNYNAVAADAVQSEPMP